jgi:heme/copper-type cytochrome/quinol oxidase subunit 2
MKCIINVQGSIVIIVVVQVGAVKIYVAAVQALRKKETQDETQFHHQNWWKKLVWVPVITFCKIFILSYAFDALLCRNWPFSPSDRLTLRITLLPNKANILNFSIR